MRSGEIHIVLDDIEYLYDGVSIYMENDPSGENTSVVYYDNREVCFDGNKTGLNTFICNDGNRSCEAFSIEAHEGNMVDSKDKTRVYLTGDAYRALGVDSMEEPAMQTGNMYSDGLLLDVWAYAPEDNTYRIEWGKAPDTVSEENTEIHHQRLGLYGNMFTGFSINFASDSEDGAVYLLHSGTDCINNCVSFLMDASNKHGVINFGHMNVDVRYSVGSAQQVDFIKSLYIDERGTIYDLQPDEYFTTNETLHVFGIEDDADTAAEARIYAIFLYADASLASYLVPCQNRLSLYSGLCDMEKEMFFPLENFQ